MKLIVAALLFALALLAGTPALAQNTTCPDVPAGDSSNRCANTRFVKGAVTAGIPLPQNNILVGNASNIAVGVPMSGDCTIVAAGIITCNDTASTTPNGLTQSVDTRLNNQPNVYDFGAVCDNSSHPLSSVYGSLAAAQVFYPHATSLTNELDWAAIQGMMNQSLPVVLPKNAQCILNLQLVGASGLSLTIRGENTNASRLTWPSTATSAGVTVDRTIATQQIYIENVSFITGQAWPTTTNQTALRINYSGAGVATSNWTAIIRNVLMVGTSFPSAGWRNGIYLQDSQFVIIEDFLFTGGQPAAANQRLALNDAGTGITFASTDDVTGITDISYLKNISITWANVAIFIDKNFEGFNLDGPQFVLVNEGVAFIGTTTPGQHTIVNGHINALIVGADIRKVYGMTIQNIVFFQNSTIDAPTASTGVSFTDVKGSTVDNCNFIKQGPSTYTHIGIGGTTGDGAKGDVFRGNKHESGEFGYFISGTLTTDLPTIIDNIFYTGMGTKYSGTLSSARGIWVPFTPTVASSAGTITAQTATGQYLIRDYTLKFSMETNISNAGTATGNLNFTLPAAAVATFDTVVSGIDNSVGTSGALMGCLLNASGTVVQCNPAAAITTHKYLTSGSVQIN